MLKAICLGRVKYDINLVVDVLPPEGSTQEFFNKVGCGGGCASNIGVGLSKWGISVAMSGVLGNDVYGTRIKEEFDNAHMDMRFIEQSFNNDTPLSTILINKSTGKHTICNISDKYVGIKKMDYDFAPDLLVSDGYDAIASKNLFERFPSCPSVLVASIITKEVMDLCRKAKYVICSLEFAESVSGKKVDLQKMETLIECFQKLKKRYLSTNFVITLGEKGALYAIGNDIKISPSLKVQVVDTHGAKDTFAMAFSYIIAKEKDFEKAVKYGCIASGLATTQIGARTSIPTLEEVRKIYEQSY